MKRAAYVVSWIAFALYVLFVVLTFVTRLPSLRYLLVVAAISGLSLVAFHASSFRPLRIVAALLNGVLALLVSVMIAVGINFAVGIGAFLTAGALLVVFVVPAVLNAIALLSYVRDRTSVAPAG
jgi:hypothetical protein